MSDKYRHIVRSLPELVLFSSDDERRQALRQANRTTHPVRRTLTTVLVSAIGSGLVVWVAFVTFPALRDMLPYCAGFIGGLTGAAVTLIWLRTTRPMLRRSLREQLVGKGVPVCLECGYDLQGQIDARCPECSTPFDEKLLKTSPAERATTRPSG